MMGFKLFVYYLLQFTWGIIQNVIGLIINIVLSIIKPKRKRFFFNGAIVTPWKFEHSMGLGIFIFFGAENSKYAKEVLVHEYGHTIQSAILGPLFLLVVALPSVIWAFGPSFVKMRKERRVSYYSLYCESNANNLGEKITGMKAPSKKRI